MVICKIRVSIICVVIFLIGSSGLSQVIFREFPDYKIYSSDQIFFDVSPTRSIIPLNGKWEVYPADEEDKPKVSVSVPSIFVGDGKFIYERKFTLTSEQIANNLMEMVFFGINYTADISLNDIIIYRHNGGEYPFKINLPRDVLIEGTDNVVSVNLIYSLHSKNTIPLKQRFLYPQNFGGITGDVYIHLKPNISFVNTSITSEITQRLDKAKIRFNTTIRNNEFKSPEDTIPGTNEFILKTYLLDDRGEVVNSLQDRSFLLERSKEINIEQVVDINNPLIWSPENPKSYLCKIELWYGERLIDVIQNPVLLYTFHVTDELIELNYKKFNLNGVTYIPSNNIYGKLVSYEQMENDIILIKDTGFNAVRFAKCVPHPYLLKLCEQYGLLAFIELPVSNIPGTLAQDQRFAARCKDFLSNYINFYNQFPAVASIGLGSSYLPGLESHTSLVNSLAAYVKEQSGYSTFASFASFDVTEIDNLDLYGLELLNTPLSDFSADVERIQDEIGKGRIIVSEATYPVSKGNTNGYVNEHSFEAQAKFYEEFIEYFTDKNIAGYFINTMFDYRGDYSSLLSGYNKIDLYNIGIIGEDRDISRLSYKVIFANLNNQEKVTIPIGSKKDDAPMEFIVYGLALALFMGVLVNSGRKFREDASRALLRPYNFFSDVRDQRIISAYHTTFLGLIIGAVLALIVSNILFYLKNDFTFEMLLLSFGVPAILKSVSYLAWNPLLSLVWLSVIAVFLVIILALIIKAASLAVRTRVYLISIYFMVIWSLLPVVLLIPVGIILYRILVADVVNIYITVAFVIITLWILYRLMKGIYVLFDTTRGTVYFYCSLIILLVFGGVLFYFEIESSAIQYLLFTFEQFKIFG